MIDAEPRQFDRVIGGDAPLTAEEISLWNSGTDVAAPLPEDLFIRLGVTRPALWLRFGRSAFGVALKLMSPASAPRLAMPDYQCADVVRKLRAAASEIVPYGLTEDLLPLQTSLLEAAGHADVVMTCSYFGAARIDAVLTDFYRDIKKLPGAPWVIEDRVMAFPDPATAASYMGRCDFCVLSLRKIYPIPDGAVLIACSDRAMDALDSWQRSNRLPDSSGSDAVVRARIKAKGQRASWLRSGHLVDEPGISGLHASIQSEGLVNETAADPGEDAVAGSEGSLRYLATREIETDLAIIHRHRKTIADALADTVCEDNCIGDGVGIAVPIRAAARDALRQRAAEDGVFLPVHWPVHDLISLSPMAAHWHATELSLPTLPTWSEDDVGYLCDRLGAVLGEMAA